MFIVALRYKRNCLFAGAESPIRPHAGKVAEKRMSGRNRERSRVSRPLMSNRFLRVTALARFPACILAPYREGQLQEKRCASYQIIRPLNWI